jgi:hypothetical protein
MMIATPQQKKKTKKDVAAWYVVPAAPAMATVWDDGQQTLRRSAVDGKCVEMYHPIQ